MNTYTFTPEQIIEKIKKLLVLADRGGTEEEAATAANMAAALSVKYGIDLAAVQGVKPGGKPRGFVTFTMHRSDKFEQWIQNLAGGVAQVHAAKSFFTVGQEGCDYCLILREELVDVVRLTVEYLIWAVRDLNRQAVKGRMLTKQGRAEFRSAFRLAASQRLRYRLVKQASDMRTKDDVAQATVGRNALVVQDHFEREVAELQEWMQEQGFEFKERKGGRRNIRSQDGWDAGLRAGDSIGLDKQIAAKPSVAGVISEEEKQAMIKMDPEKRRLIRMIRDLDQSRKAADLANLSFTELSLIYRKLRGWD